MATDDKQAPSIAMQASNILSLSDEFNKLQLGITNSWGQTDKLEIKNKSRICFFLEPFDVAIV